jgi:hypothetical protein
MPRAKSAAEARATPGLKLQTPLEYTKTDLRLLSNVKRWEYLFSLNVWQKPSTK